LIVASIYFSHPPLTLAILLWKSFDTCATVNKSRRCATSAFSLPFSLGQWGS